MLGAWELGWRARGAEPSCRLTSGAFASHWHGARAAPPDAIVMIGSSRFQTGLDPALVAAAAGRPAVLVALSGGNPIPLAEHLVRDTAFAGTLVIEVMPTRFFSDDTEAWTGAERYVRMADAGGFSDPLEQRLKAALFSRLVLLHPQLSPLDLLPIAVRDRGLPTAPYLSVRPDGYAVVASERTDMAARQAEWVARYEARTALTPDAIAAQLAPFADALDALRARGGDVLLLRPPSSGDVLEVEERRFPRSLYDRYVPPLGDAVHFADVPDLADLACPDGSHLDRAGAVALSGWVGRRLAR